MTRTIGIKIICVATALILALASIFGVAKITTDPAFYQKSIAALEEKQETVLELTAASTAASAAITLLPGDTATPIADKLADLSGYFLIVLCAIFLEKYLLTITAAAAFKVLIPAACAAFAAAALFPCLRRTAGALAWKLTLFSIAIMLVIPTGIRVSDLIEDTYQASIAATIQEAKDATDTIQNSQSENAETEQSGLSGFFSKVTDSITGAAAGAVEKLRNVLNRFLEALAVMLVTTCLIPILVPLFVSAFRIAQDLAMAMEARCYRGGEHRTRMHEMKLKGRDYAAIVMQAVFLAIIIIEANFAPW